MKKSTKYGLIGAAAGILAISLVPFELKKEDNGDFTYKSLLIGFTKKNNENGKADTTITFFNKPNLEKFKTVPEKIGAMLRRCKRDTVTLEFFDDDESAEAIAQELPTEE